MGWAERLPSGRYRGVYRDQQGRRVTSEPVRSRAAAEAWADEEEEQSRHGRHRDPRAGRLTLREWQRLWADARLVEDTTAAADASRITAVLAQFGDWPLAAITTMAVQGWIKRLAAECAASTVHKHAAVLSSMLGAAVREQLVPDNPCRHVTLPTLPGGREVYLTRDEVDAVADVLGEPHATIVLTLAYTGLRWGELAGLHLRRLDMLRGTLDVVDVLTEVAGVRKVREHPKSRNNRPNLARRELRLPRHLLDALAAHLARFPVAPCPPSVAHPRAMACSGLVFTRPRVGTLTRHWGADVLTPALRRAGVDKSATPHDLRHSYASWLVQAGVPIREVQRLLGHASVTTTERYSHWAPDAGEQARQVLEQVSDQDRTCGKRVATYPNGPS